ncbi:MAG: hypothetical protein ACKV2U_22310 [Bryobacteraceae bacterium]
MENNTFLDRLFKRTSMLALAAVCALCAPADISDPGWPRRFADGGAELVVHQPQVDQWTEFKELKGRYAFTLRTAEGRSPVYGTLRFDGNTIVDVDRRIVLLRNIRKFDMRFPASPGGVSKELADLTARLMPSDAVVLSLDRLLAFVRAAEVPTVEARVLTDPPPIYVSTDPAVLVIVDGPPLMAEVEKTGLRRVVNTNWPLYQDPASKAFYLQHGEAWLKAPELRGTYTIPVNVPAELPRLPAPKPGDAPPRVIVVGRPAELIMTEGPPQFTQIGNSSLSSVTNTGSDLFFESASWSYYYLTSGRWFKATTLQGPWVYASASLPPAFLRIPAEHPRAHVLAAVPGTREAEDAVLLAAIPRTAEINRAQAKAEVQYAGSPEFVPIAGTAISYARNTPNDVLKVGDLYYLCLQGVWFVSAKAAGPWQTADRVPPEIYTIPESSPKYNVTYVRVYDSTPSTITVGYTAGYNRSYVSNGVVVWGTGYYHAPYVAIGVAAPPVYWASPCYTYGASAWYNPATGIYARGAAAYGPYGGYGAAAAYNPRTGNYSAGYRASNPYGSWGEGVVTNGSDWARGGYRSGDRGTVAAGETSKGGAGVAVSGARGNSGYLAKNSSGDVYAGANGNVYKRDNGQWYQNQNGSWNAMDKGAGEAQRQQAAARDWGTRNAEMSERGRSRGTRGIEQRPQFQGRRR